MTMSVTADHCQDRSTYGPEFHKAEVYPVSEVSKVYRIAKVYRDNGVNARVFQRVIRVNRLSIGVCVLVIRKELHRG